MKKLVEGSIYKLISQQKKLIKGIEVVELKIIV